MSEGLFKVGDICEGKDFIFYKEFNGMECEIVMAHDMYKVTDEFTMKDGLMAGYTVRWANGSEYVVMHKHLRKRKPPAPYKDFDTVVSWENMPWKPVELEVPA